jgi:HK97 family phage prohead protease
MHDTLDHLLTMASRPARANQLQKTAQLREFRRGVRRAVAKPLLYDMRGFGAVAAGMLERVARGERVRDAEIHDMFARGPSLVRGVNGNRSVAIVPVRGVALYDCELQPICFSTLKLARDVTQLASDPEIETILLDIDSPGGAVTGIAECGDAIWAARKRTKVVGLASPLCASAAFWIGSQCSELIAVRSADIGSVGVFMAHTDCSKFNEMNGLKVSYVFAGAHKVEGNSNEPLSDEAKAYYQSEVDTIYRDFTQAVARGRGTTVHDVVQNYGKGRCMAAPMAKKFGLIDRIVSSPDEALQLIMSPSADRRARLASLKSTPLPVSPKERPVIKQGNEASQSRRVRLDKLRAEGPPTKQTTPTGLMRIRGFAAHFGIPNANGNEYTAATFQGSIRPHEVRMLLEHDTSKVIGRWDDIRITPNGLWVEGRIAPTTPAAAEAAAAIVNDGVAGLSISMHPDSLKTEKSKFSGRTVVTKAKLREISVTRNPADALARLSFEAG